MEVSKEYAVQMHGITKLFGSFCALDHVDLDVKRGTSTLCWEKMERVKAR